MKILFITNNLPPIVDGVGDYTYNIAKQFVEHEHEVYIICRNNPQINTQVQGMTILPIIDKWDRNCYKPIISIIQKKVIDVVSLQYVPHGFHPKGLPFSIIKLTKKIKKRCNIKLFTFFHEVSVEKEKGNIKRTLLSMLMQHISKRVIENSDYVATSIEYYKNVILKLVPDKKDIPIIPIASNIPATNLSKEELFTLKKELAPNNEIIISFFGIRNIQTSIDAISNLKDKGYKLKILLIGKTHNLPKNLPNDTIKTGVLNIDEIDKFCKVSDIFILPQDNIYGCSFKSGSFVTELRNALPVITAKGKMTSTFLEDKKNILFANFENKNEIEKALLFLLNNPSIAFNIGAKAQNIVKDFSWEKTYNKYNNILK